MTKNTKGLIVELTMSEIDYVAGGVSQSCCKNTVFLSASLSVISGTVIGTLQIIQNTDLIPRLRVNGTTAAVVTITMATIAAPSFATFVVSMSYSIILLYRHAAIANGV